MEKVLKIEVDNKGYLWGTLGWVCKNADNVKIGTTKAGKQGAWIKNKEGDTLVTLAIRSFHEEDGKVVKMQNEDSSWNELSACESMCSDACWRKIEEIQEEVVKIMDAEWESDEGEQELTLVREKVNDEENL